MPRPADLPDFSRPPIDEVVISLPFIVMPQLSDAIIGLFWLKVRDTFPRTDTVPRIDLQIEEFSSDPSSPVGRPPHILPEFVQAVPGARTWFISENDVLVLQVQNGRFTQNWRRRGEDPYPRFELLMESFWTYYGKFCELLIEEGVPQPLVQQVELNYVNWITDLTMASFLRPEAPAISTPGMDQEPENQIATYRYIIRSGSEPDSAPMARLHVDARPAMRVSPGDQELGTQFTLSYRSPVAATSTDVLTLNNRFELGREAIVRTFTDLTSDSAHEHWGRIPK